MRASFPPRYANNNRATSLLHGRMRLPDAPPIDSLHPLVLKRYKQVGQRLGHYVSCTAVVCTVVFVAAFTCVVFVVNEFFHVHAPLFLHTPFPRRAGTLPYLILL